MCIECYIKMSSSSSSSVYLVFQHGTMLNVMLGDCTPQWCGAITLKHVKIMLERPCGRGSCEYCPESERQNKESGNPHYIVYYVTRFNGWTRVVDFQRLFLLPNEYTYLKVDIPQPDRFESLLEQQLGKSLNHKGFFLNFVFGTKYGLTTKQLNNEENSDKDIFTEKKEWMCCELAVALLADQGLGGYFSSLDPCQTRPYDLWVQAKEIMNSQVLRYHPSLKQMPMEGEGMNYPPGWA